MFAGGTERFYKCTEKQDQWEKHSCAKRPLFQNLKEKGHRLGILLYHFKAVLESFRRV